jgi:PadR family transcriptional regulator, regulatory protein PadR
MEKINQENTQAQMRKGTLEFIILLLISKGPVYATDILNKLKENQLIVVEGTLYPLLSRLKNGGLLEYDWRESKNGPPRKYYTLTIKGQETLTTLTITWKSLDKSIRSLLGGTKN